MKYTTLVTITLLSVSCLIEAAKLTQKELDSMVNVSLSDNEAQEETPSKSDHKRSRQESNTSPPSNIKRRWAWPFSGNLEEKQDPHRRKYDDNEYLAKVTYSSSDDEISSIEHSSDIEGNIWSDSEFEIDFNESGKTDHSITPSSTYTDEPNEEMKAKLDIAFLQSSDDEESSGDESDLAPEEKEGMKAFLEQKKKNNK